MYNARPLTAKRLLVLDRFAVAWRLVGAGGPENA
jgi:hypothetical protein